MENLVSINIPEADKQIISAAIQTINDKLNPYLHALTDKERMGGQKLGDKSVAYVQKSLKYAVEFPQTIPPYLSIAELRADVEGTTLLSGWASTLSNLVRGIEDTAMIAGVEAMDSANVVYAALKGAAQSNIPGAQAAVNDMKMRYQRNGGGNGGNDANVTK